MLKFLIFMGHLLECFEKNYPQIFWFSSFFLTSLVNFVQSPIIDKIRFQKTQSVIVIKKKTSSISSINSGSEGSKRKFDSFLVQTDLEERKKFKIVFHRQLEQHFPDWEERMNY